MVMANRRENFGSHIGALWPLTYFAFIDSLDIQVLFHFAAKGLKVLITNTKD